MTDEALHELVRTCLLRVWIIGMVMLATGNDTMAVFLSDFFCSATVLCLFVLVKTWRDS